MDTNFIFFDIDQAVIIKKENQDNTKKALIKLAEDEPQLFGCGNKREDYTHEIYRQLSKEPLDATLWRADWLSSIDKDGNLLLSDYMGLRNGYMEEIFKTIAPYVEDGGAIELHLYKEEYIDFFKYLFKNGSVYRYEGDVIFDESEEQEL